jgi:hypothetical protein
MKFEFVLPKLEVCCYLHPPRKALRWPASCSVSPHRLISIDPDAGKTRHALPSESRVLICPTFEQYKTELGQARDRAQFLSFNFLHPLIWVFGSISVPQC